MRLSFVFTFFITFILFIIPVNAISIDFSVTPSVFNNVYHNVVEDVTGTVENQNSWCSISCSYLVHSMSSWVSIGTITKGKSSNFYFSIVSPSTGTGQMSVPVSVFCQSIGWPCTAPLNDTISRTVVMNYDDSPEEKETKRQIEDASRNIDEAEDDVETSQTVIEVVQKSINQAKLENYDTSESESDLILAEGYQENAENYLRDSKQNYAFKLYIDAKDDALEAKRKAEDATLYATMASSKVRTKLIVEESDPEEFKKEVAEEVAEEFSKRVTESLSEEISESITTKMQEDEAKTGIAGIPLKYVAAAIAIVGGLLTLTLRGREIHKWLDERKRKNEITLIVTMIVNKSSISRHCKNLCLNVMDFN